MKMRGKGKGKVHPDSFSVLNLLPAAVLTLLSTLSDDDRHVLAYMLSRSLKSDTNNKNPLCSDGRPADFHCDCFRCYTAFWLRWDSSPNRDLIHRAIEAFEDHLANGNDHFKRPKGRKKDRITRRKLETPSAGGTGVLSFSPPRDIQEGAVSVAVDDDAAPEGDADVKGAVEEEAPPAVSPAPCSSHKALARKVLPDVMGIFNSRLWRLWSPNA